MFAIPESYSHFNILCIDPGLNNIGVALLEMESHPLKIERISATTIKEETVIDHTSYDDEYVADRTIKRARMVEGVLRFVQKNNPSVVVCESPFFDRFRPGSFAILTEVVNDIFQGILAYNNNIRLCVVEPLLIKHTLGVAGQKGKDVVRDAMSKMTEVVSLLESPLDSLDEHAIDAIGAGVTFVRRRLSDDARSTKKGKAK